MPRAATVARGNQGAVINLSIPMRLMRGAHDGEGEGDDTDDDDTTCYICAHTFCATDECGRAQTQLGCCSQPICSACLLKGCKRCTCKEDCDAVISFCPFCREVSPVDALDMFLGAKPACARCAKRDAVESTASAAVAAAAPAAGTVATTTTTTTTRERRARGVGVGGVRGGGGLSPVAESPLTAAESPAQSSVGDTADE